MNRRLYRSRTDTILGGVASGVASYLNTDPALVRIAWAILVPLTGGAALLAYIVGWIVVPEEPYPGAASGSPAVPPSADGSETADEGTPMQAAASTGSGSSWTPPAPIVRSSDGRAGMVVGIGLVLIGLWFLVREYLPPIRWNLIWPVIIVAVGAIILISAMRRRDS